MKPIKVNYWNDEGKRTSTTINQTIAWHFFHKYRTDDEAEKMRKGNSFDSAYDKMVHKMVQKKAQDFVKELEKHDSHLGEPVGANKRDIEEHMMMKIRY